jgi:hypothetical protein
MRDENIAGSSPRLLIGYIEDSFLRYNFQIAKLIPAYREFNLGYTCKCIKNPIKKQLTYLLAESMQLLLQRDLPVKRLLIGYKCFGSDKT